MAASGRPPLNRNDPSVPICVKVPSRDYDRLCDRARQARVTVPEVVRRSLHANDERPGKRNRR